MPDNLLERAYALPSQAVFYRITSIPISNPNPKNKDGPSFIRLTARRGTMTSSPDPPLADNSISIHLIHVQI
jgi:hypothetical protein